jgi:hypothetical protein
MRLGCKEKLFLQLTPVGAWVQPSKKGFKKYGIRERVIESLKRKKYIKTARLIGGNFGKWDYVVKRVK